MDKEKLITVFLLLVVLIGMTNPVLLLLIIMLATFAMFLKYNSEREKTVYVREHYRRPPRRSGCNMILVSGFIQYIISRVKNIIFK